MTFPDYLRRYHDGMTHHQFGALTAEEQLPIHREWLAWRNRPDWFQIGSNILIGLACLCGGMVLVVATRGMWG